MIISVIPDLFRDRRLHKYFNFPQPKFFYENSTLYVWICVLKMSCFHSACIVNFAIMQKFKACLYACINVYLISMSCKNLLIILKYRYAYML